MSIWIDACHQPFEVIDGVTHVRPCPCYYCNDCPNATLDCKMGKQYCVYDSYKKKNIPTPFRFELLDTVHYLHIPQVYTRCAGCIFRLKHEYYNICEVRPFKEVVEDLPF